MSKIFKILLIPIWLVCYLTAHSQAEISDQTLSQHQVFEKTLFQATAKFEKTDSLQNKLAAIKLIDQVATKWSDHWMPQYYAAYYRIIISYLLKKEKQRDSMIDQAEMALVYAKKMGGVPEDEFLVMEAYAANARLAVSPFIRWAKYGSIFEKKLGAAKRVNLSNPRIYFLEGQSIYYTPKAFGGGAKKAMPYFSKAGTYFKSERMRKNDKPRWGYDENEKYILLCKKAMN